MARGEPEAPIFAQLIKDAPSASVSSATILETSLVLRDPEAQEFLDATVLGIDVIAFDARQLSVAREAHRRYGRGSGHRARLNFGDCFSYALAITSGEPLLFKGEGFALTDVTPAYVPG